MCSGMIWSHCANETWMFGKCNTAVCGSKTSTRSARVQGLELLNPAAGSRLTRQVKARSCAVTGTPSLQARSAFNLIVTAMPFVPSGRSSSLASPFSSVGTSVHSRQMSLPSAS